MTEHPLDKNSVIIRGNLTRIPEKFQGSHGIPGWRFQVASRTGTAKRRVIVDILTYNQVADLAMKLKVGDRVYVEGTLVNRKRRTNGTKKILGTQVEAHLLYLYEDKKATGDNPDVFKKD